MLAVVERAADALFGDLLASVEPAAASRVDALTLPGFTLVALDDEGGPAGFVQVLDLDGSFHLEQLSVHPSAQRRGLGARLLAAAEDEVRARGGTALTLRTFADMPWNGPFYSRRGYREAELPVALRWLVVAEERSGLAAAGRRVSLRKQLAPDIDPLPAVSVLPLRDGAAGLEVFVQFRATSMDFAAGAVVFPGGRVDPSDTAVPVPSSHRDAWAATGLPDPGVLAAAAVREVREECGVALSAADLVPWDDWITPPGGRRRFDVAFYLTAAGPEQDWRNTTTEAVAAGWRQPSALLAEADAGTLRLMPPTRSLLAELAGFARTADALALVPVIAPVLHDAGQRPRSFQAG